MTAARTTGDRPELRLLDGSRLPVRLWAVHELLMRAPDLLRSQLARLAARRFASRLPAMRAAYPDGRLFVIPAGDAMYAQVFIHGAYEPAESRVTAALLRPGDFAVDLGANLGWYSLLMASAVGDTGRVWAIEPVPQMVAGLRANLDLNPGARIEVKPLAVGQEAGVAKLHLFAGLVHGHASISSLGRSDFTEHEVELRTLDQLLAGAEAAPALVKLDVEGAELSVLRGARRCIESDEAPIWMIEVNDETSAALGYRPEQLPAELRAMRPHAVYRVREGRLVREERPGDAPHGSTWVCVPDGRADRVLRLIP